MQALAGLLGLVSFACYVLTVIRAFKTDGTTWGILSLCGLLGFFWGWKNAGRLDSEAEAKGEKLVPPAKLTMIVWTAAVVLASVVSRLAAASAG